VPRVTRNLQQIVSQSERAGGIIREMRSLIKKKRPQFAAVDLNAVMQSVLPLMRAEMADKSVELALELSEPLPRVCADTIQMEQVLLNLTRNAIDAMTGGEEYARRLTIRTKAVEGDMVQMEVCDTGVGLPAVDPGRIFEPFFTTKKEGLGLGLSISRSIVQMHQGVLTATRNPDRGSTFLVTLPAQPSGNR
jgi:signal transduction histidine kinase